MIQRAIPAPHIASCTYLMLCWLIRVLVLLACRHAKIQVQYMRVLGAPINACSLRQGGDKKGASRDLRPLWVCFGRRFVATWFPARAFRPHGRDQSAGPSERGFVLLGLHLFS
ncbi:hypothetical protein HDV62DRAFT_292201 [Trichoderma sp. SZMC 28011]